MAHVATGAYSRPGDYERAYNRDVQASALYRESNSQLDYFSRPPEAIHSNSSTRPPNGAISEAHYFPSIATGIGPLSNRLSALELAEQAGLGRPSSPTNNLRKAMKAVEEAESAIMEQMQENEQLRNELQLTTWELQNYKPEGAPALRQPEENLHHVAQKVEVPPPTEKNGLEDSGGVSIVNREKWVANGSQGDLEGTLVVHRNLPPEYNNHVSPPPTALSASQNHSSSNTLNGNPRGLISGQPGADCTSFSQISSPSSRSVSPNRYHREGDFGRIKD